MKGEIMKTLVNMFSNFAILLLFLILLCSCSQGVEGVNSKNTIKSHNEHGDYSLVKDIDIDIDMQKSSEEIWEKRILANNSLTSIEIKSKITHPKENQYNIYSMNHKMLRQHQVDSFINDIFPKHQKLDIKRNYEIFSINDIDKYIKILSKWKDSSMDGDIDYWEQQIKYYKQLIANSEEGNINYDFTKFSSIPAYETLWLFEVKAEKNENLFIKEVEWVENNKIKKLEFDFLSEQGKEYEINAATSSIPYLNYLYLSGYVNNDHLTDIRYLEFKDESYETALRIATNAVKKLGINYMHVNCEFTNYISEDYILDNPKYRFIFTREIDKEAITYKHNCDSDVESWGQEYLDICVNNDGINYLYWSDAQSDNIEVISKLNNIISINEMKEIALSELMKGNINHSFNSRSYEIYKKEGKVKKLYSNSIIIDEIVFGFMKVNGEKFDQNFVLIPVWDFIGRESINMDTEHNTNDELINVKTELPSIGHGHRHSFLTINAIDGSIIDRKMGY